MLRILPPTIAEDIREAQMMLATLGGGTDGRDPPLDALATCVEDMHLWAGEAARAVTSIAACYRGKAARNSMTAVSDKVAARGAEGPQPVAAPRTTAFQLADTFAPPKTPRLTQHTIPLSTGAQKLVTEITTRAAQPKPVTRSSSRQASITVGQTPEGTFGWPRERQHGTAEPTMLTLPHAWDEEHSNDTSMEEYVHTMLSNPFEPAAPVARGRVSGVPALVRVGPRTRSASLDQRQPAAAEMSMMTHGRLMRPQAKQPAEPIADGSGGVLDNQGHGNPVSNIGRPISDSVAAATRADLMMVTARGLNHATGHGHRGNWQATDSDPSVREVTVRLHAVAVNCMAAMEANPPYRMEDPPRQVNDSLWKS